MGEDCVHTSCQLAPAIAIMLLALLLVDPAKWLFALQGPFRLSLFEQHCYVQPQRCLNATQSVVHVCLQQLQC